MQTPEQRRQSQDRKVASGYYRYHLQQWRSKALDKLGRKCVQCGFSDERALHIDHVNNDGHEERKGTTAVQRYKLVVNDTEGRYQTLCANCNFIKKHEVHKQKYGEIKYGQQATGTGSQ